MTVTIYRYLKIPSTRVSLVAQMVKNLPAVQETWVRSLGWEDPLEKGRATHSSILAWKVPWTVQSMGLQRVGHDWVTCTSLHFNLYRIGVWFWTFHVSKQPDGHVGYKLSLDRNSQPRQPLRITYKNQNSLETIYFFLWHDRCRNYNTYSYDIWSINSLTES